MTRLPRERRGTNATGGLLASPPMFLPLVMLLAADPAAWEKVTTIDGVSVEQRAVSDSKFVELRFTATTDKTPESLCAAVFGDGKFDKDEPDLKSRKVLSETADTRITHDQITPPLVNHRDYVVKAHWAMEGGACRMTFEATDELAPPLADGSIRVTKVRGYWLFEPADGKTKLTYVVFSDPGGAIPPWIAEGTRRTLGVKWVKMIDSRGKKPL